MELQFTEDFWNSSFSDSRSPTSHNNAILTSFLHFFTTSLMFDLFADSVISTGLSRFKSFDVFFLNFKEHVVLRAKSGASG